ncbi:MAG: hypothetical protein QM813_28400 [Verrucomicrobiota bacterium]
MYSAGEEAKKKGLKVVAGTQRRHHPGYIETIKRIHDGAIGDVTALRAYWVNSGPIWHRGVKGDSESGDARSTTGITISGCARDHIVEQHVHNIDVCNWIDEGSPGQGLGHGRPPATGRQVR